MAAYSSHFPVMSLSLSHRFCSGLFLLPLPDTNSIPNSWQSLSCVACAFCTFSRLTYSKDCPSSSAACSLSFANRFFYTLSPYKAVPVGIRLQLGPVYKQVPVVDLG